MDSIYEFVKSARDEYYNRTIEVIPGYEFSQHDTLRAIELYYNSQFTTDRKDKPETREVVLQHLQIPRKRRYPRNGPRPCIFCMASSS
jgi:hypothetical protein